MPDGQALVLGGGGVAGIAGMTGVLAGLAEALSRGQYARSRERDPTLSAPFCPGDIFLVTVSSGDDASPEERGRLAAQSDREPSPDCGAAAEPGPTANEQEAFRRRG